MRVIEGKNIDLINPFPSTEAKRVFGWLHCYRNIIEHDLSPKTAEEYEQLLQQSLPSICSYGVIDKLNQLSQRHEAPLIGLIAFEPATIWNWYIHLATPRKAWGSGFIDEAIPYAITDFFFTNPDALRISGYVLENNGPIKGLARRMGFKFEGAMQDMLLQNGTPKTVLHFGMTRRTWMDLLQAFLEDQNSQSGEANELHEEISQSASECGSDRSGPLHGGDLA